MYSTTIFIPIHNPEEFDERCKLLLIQTKTVRRLLRANQLQHRAFLKTHSLSKYKEEVQIERIHIVDNRTVDHKSTVRGAGRTVTGALLGGAVGAILASASNYTVWDIDIDIYLTDGRCVEANISSQSVAAALHPFMLNEKREAARQKRREWAAAEQFAKEVAINADAIAGIKRLYKCSDKEARTMLIQSGAWNMPTEEAIKTVLTSRRD